MKYGRFRENLVAKDIQESYLFKFKNGYEQVMGIECKRC